MNIELLSKDILLELYKTKRVNPVILLGYKDETHFLESMIQNSTILFIQWSRTLYVQNYLEGNNDYTGDEKKSILLFCLNISSSNVNSNEPGYIERMAPSNGSVKLVRSHIPLDFPEPPIRVRLELFQFRELGFKLNYYILREIQDKWIDIESEFKKYLVQYYSEKYFIDK